jgi:hypothetical protein
MTFETDSKGKRTGSGAQNDRSWHRAVVPSTFRKQQGGGRQKIEYELVNGKNGKASAENLKLR